MRIDSSTISMAATRSYKAETEATQTSIIRGYGADGKLEQAQVTKATTRAATAELTGSAAVYTTSGDGLSLASQGESHSADSETKPGNVENAARPASVPAALPDNGDWLGDIASEIENDPKIQMLRKMLELLEQWDCLEPPMSAVLLMGQPMQMEKGGCLMIKRIAVMGASSPGTTMGAFLTKHG